MTDDRGSSIRRFTGSDGSALRYRTFDQEEPSHTLLYLHGIESHGGWFLDCAALLQAKGMRVHLLDRRGSGLNREDARFIEGHTDRFETLVGDVLRFAESERERDVPMHLIGLSWGGKVAVAAAIARGDLFKSVVLVTPGLKAKVDLTLPRKLKVALGVLFKPTAKIPIPIEPEMFTRTPGPLSFIRSDPLRLHHATARFFLESRRLDRHLERRIGDLALPTLLLLAEREEIIDNEGVLGLLKRSRAPLTLRQYEGIAHSLQFEAKERLVADIADHVGRAVMGRKDA